MKDHYSQMNLELGKGMPLLNSRYFLLILVIFLAAFTNASSYQQPNIGFGQNPKTTLVNKSTFFENSRLDSSENSFANSSTESNLIENRATISNVRPDLTGMSPIDLAPDIRGPAGDTIANRNSRFGLKDIPISIGAVWLPGVDTELTSVDTSIKFPLLLGFGSPPPIVKAGFVYSNLETPAGLGLPAQLNEYSIGASKVFRFGDRWTLRSMIGVALATDGQNVSSDAWQFRGGVFGIYQYNENWQWTMGAIALGRDDLPVVPAIGAVWTPNPRIRWDLIPPNPRLNFLLFETESQENWIYTGFGFNGTTWGYRTLTGVNDRLTYRDLRVVAGWQSRPQGEPGVPYVRGRKYNVEAGYTFSRYLEFNQDLARQRLDDAWMLQISTRY